MLMLTSRCLLLLQMKDNVFLVCHHFRQVTQEFRQLSNYITRVGQCDNVWRSIKVAPG
jgi:hypothetical protein